MTIAPKNRYATAAGCPTTHTSPVRCYLNQIVADVRLRGRHKRQQLVRQLVPKPGQPPHQHPHPTQPPADVKRARRQCSSATPLPAAARHTTADNWTYFAENSSPMAVYRAASDGIVAHCVSTKSIVACSKFGASWAERSLGVQGFFGMRGVARSAPVCFVGMPQRATTSLSRTVPCIS